MLRIEFYFVPEALHASLYVRRIGQRYILDVLIKKDCVRAVMKYNGEYFPRSFFRAFRAFSCGVPGAKLASEGKRVIAKPRYAVIKGRVSYKLFYFAVGAKLRSYFSAIKLR